MIAILKPEEPENKTGHDRLQPVRHLVGNLLLAKRSDDESAALPIAPWKTRLLVGWATVAVVFYFAKMLDLY